MNKLVSALIILLCCGAFRDLKAQGFSYTNLGPVLVQLTYIPDSIQSVNRRAVVRNNSSSEVHFRFARIVNDIPAGWLTAMGYDLSYPPFVDSIPLFTDPPFSIPPGYVDTLFFIYFVCNGPGLGTAVVRMFNVDNPAEYVQDTFKVQIGTVGITQTSASVMDYNLSQNYPNPFNPTTNIKFSIPRSQRVSLKIFDILGNEVELLINDEMFTAGAYEVEFNGNKFSSGIYYYSLTAENFTDTKKMIFLK